MLGQPPPSAARSVDVSPDEFRDFASNAVLAADRLSADERPSHISQIRSGGWGFDLAEVNGRLKVEGALDSNHMAVVVVERAAGSAICGFPLRENMVLVLSKGTRIAASAHPGLSYHATTLPSTVWHDIWRSTVDDGIEPPGADIEAFDLGALGPAAHAAASGIASRLTSLANDSRLSDRPPDELADHVGAIVHGCMPASSIQLDRSLRHRMRQAWQAQDFIRAHLHEEISVLELCREMKVSRRQLEYAFRTAFDVSPKEFIQLMKLNEGRRLLMTGRKRGLSVTDVVMEVGVNHLGRFSTAYRKLFGEMPKATLSGSDT